MKKILSLLLSLSMLVGLFVLPAYAAPENITEAEPAEEAITETVDAEEALLPNEAEETPAELEEAPAETEVPATDGDTPDPIDEMLAGAPTDPEVTSGAISGTDIQWAVDKATGALTVSGTGVLPDYENFKDTPWWDCRAVITKIVVGPGITAIGKNDFRCLPLNAEISLPDGLITIGQDAFSYNLSLTSIVLPDSVTTIKDSAFKNCHALKNVVFSASLKTIEEDAFCETSLEAINLPDGLTYIGDYAFLSHGATYTELTLPGSLGAMDTTPFVDYEKLVTATLKEGITVVPPYFFNVARNLETLNLPSTIEVLGEEFILKYLFTNEDGQGRQAKLKAINIADRDGYDFAGWLDETGTLFTSEEICAGADYTGDLLATWLRSWTEGTFTDVKPTAWYHDAVQVCYQLELMNGMSATTFKPQGVGTRAQTVTILYRLAGEPEVTSTAAFSDVKAGQWYSDAVAWASEAGITTGYPDGTFRPNRAVSRQEFVTFLYRLSVYLELVEKDAAWSEAVLGDFPDKDRIATWAVNAEAWSVAVGLQQGSRESDGTILLRPASTVTRAELATYLCNYCLGEWLDE